MSYLGEYRIDDFIMLVANTHQFASGAAFAPSAITYRVYENTTATEIVNDTAMTNFDSVTGLYMDFIQATAALGYEAGKTYTVLIKATVDSVAAITARSFRILTAPVNLVQIDGTALSTHASGMAPADLRDIAGAAVSTSSAQLGVNAVNLGGTAQTGRDVGASVLLSSGTGTGQLDFTSGVVKANLAQILGTALTETAGLIAAGFKKFFNIATPTGTVNSLPDVVPGASGGLPTVDSTNSVKFQTPIKRNTALANFTFAMYDTSGDLATGLTVTMTRSIDGATPAACANAVAEVTSGAGRYKINLDASDVNGTEICFVATASGARDLSFTLHTAP